MKDVRTINLENVLNSEVEAFSVRDTVRAVIFDDKNNIAILYVRNDNFYKLPGGGVENDEGLITALERECQEEVGAEIINIVELVKIIEIKKTQKTIQNSFCYIARVKGLINKPKFTENENQRGFEVKWVEIDKAIELIKNSGYSSIIGRYVYERELTILESAKNLKYK